MMKKYANKEWCELNNKELTFYDYCRPLWFKFNEKEFIRNDGAYGKVEKYEISKILYNSKNESLEIYSLIRGDVTLKISITEKDKHCLNINYVYYVDSEDESSIKINSVYMDKSEFKKLKEVKACNLNRSKKVQKKDSLEEPPAPPQ